MSTIATETTAAFKPGVLYVIDNNKYPDYIRNHAVFHKQNRIAKVFPSIGLPNTQEDCEYSNNTDARNDALNLIYSDIRNALYRGMDTYGISTPIRNLLNDVTQSIISYYTLMAVEEEGKITLKFHVDTGNFDGKTFIKKGEGVFKAYNKLAEKCKEVSKLTLTPLESMPYFKSFSSNNVPGNKKFKLNFSSSGEEGLWDIATISMRGISSCQTWGSSQSRGLIGSMSSKYVGVIYVTSGEKFNEHGSKMLRRSMVRFCINKTTKKPGLLCDRIYPADDQGTRTLFREFLKKKTNLPVIFPNETEWTEYQLPADGSWKVAPFQQNEYTYMDTKIPWLNPQQVVPKDTTPYYNRIAQIDNDILNKVDKTITKMLDEHVANKNTHKDIFKGGVANLMLSIKRHIGGRFSNSIVPNLYNVVTTTTHFPRPEGFATTRDYEKAVIRHAFIRMRELEKSSINRCKSLGKFMKFYPKSIDKYVSFIIGEYKKELVAMYKNLL